MSEAVPVDVETKRTKTGAVLPVAFHWQGRRLIVRSWGRAWEDGAGRHVLVMVESGRVFELIQRPVEGAWQALNRPSLFPLRSLA